MTPGEPQCSPTKQKYVSEGEPPVGQTPLRIPVTVIDVLTQHWRVVPGKTGAPGIAVSCPKCPEEHYFGMFRTGGIRSRACPNCGAFLVPRRPSVREIPQLR